MKILQVVFHLGPGGAERFAVDLSNELAKSHEVAFLALKGESKSSFNLNFYLKDLSRSVNYKNLGLKDGLHLFTLIKVYKIIREEKPDIVHYHGEAMPYWLLLSFILLPRVRFIQTIHSDMHNGYESFIYKIIAKIPFLSKHISFVALSETNFQQMKKMYPSYHGTCILNGRAPIRKTERYEEVKKEVNNYRDNDSTKIFLHIARCDIAKNQRRLIVAFNAFVAEGGNAHLLIIGGGYDSPLGINLKTLAGSNIHFVGQKTNISDYHLCSDAFCLSSDVEGMPITILEALLVGNPVLSTPVCGAVDVIVNGTNGILSKDFTDEAYLQSLRDLYENIKSIKSKMSLQQSEPPYCIKKCAEKYLSFYNHQ